MAIIIPCPKKNFRMQITSTCHCYPVTIYYLTAMLLYQTIITIIVFGIGSKLYSDAIDSKTSKIKLIN